MLKATGIHRQASGQWRFSDPPDEKHGVSAVWDCLRQIIFKAEGEPRSVDQVFRALADPPYGVMDGLHPVLLCAFMLAHPDETTLYREGTFIPEPTVADFEVLMRRPELFAVAGSHMSPGRTAVVERIAKGLSVEPATVPVVRALFRIVKGLPEFARSTMKLTPTTIAMRQAFATAKSPERFLFSELPRALGAEPLATEGLDQASLDTFFTFLNHSLQEWSRATPTMIDSLVTTPS